VGVEVRKALVILRNPEIQLTVLMLGMSLSFFIVGKNRSSKCLINKIKYGQIGPYLEQ
jgi:hypothetical protein